MNEFYRLVADTIVVVHLLYLALTVGGLIFIISGAVLGWRTARTPWFRIAHLLAVVLVALEAAAGITCPLTEWEYDLRQLAGGPVEGNISFVARLARHIIFYDLPEWVFTLIHSTFGLLVVATFLVIPPRLTKKEAAP